MATLLPPPSPTSSQKHATRESDDEDADTASQRSISLSSPPTSRRNSELSDPRHSFTMQSSDSESRKAPTVSVDHSDAYADDEGALYVVQGDAPETSASPVIDEPREFKPITYPPSPPNRDDTMSITSFASTSSRKARPESLIIAPTTEPLVLGVALVDFNHLVSYLIGHLM